MSLVINTNIAASASAVNLTHSNQSLQKSLARLSSGSRIVNPADDAGGLAVSLKIDATISRTRALKNNLQNSLSFLQSQDGALKNATKILDRMSELRIMAEDVAKSTDDVANYNAEFTELQSQLGLLTNENFNGVSLFANGGNTLSTIVTEDGQQTVDISQADLQGTTNTVTSASSLTSITITDVVTAIESVATMRAINGATSSRIGFSIDMLSVNALNLEAANSRIKDTDIAEESTMFARYNILVQSGTAMLAQANQASQAALRLLQ
ncbi:MAG: flagellin [Opitutales bacterium]